MSTELQAHYDAIVVGSGPGGSAVTYRLAQSGKRVLLIERGRELKADASLAQGRIGRYLYDEVPAHQNASQFLGGETKFYGAAMYRLRESDFQSVAHETGASPGWPFGYDALEPYYGEAEQLYKVHGDADGDPTEPLRSAPLPFGPLPHSHVVAPFVQRLKDSGTTVSSVPRGLDYGPDGKCVLCATCDAYFCQLDAKMDAENSTLRPALRTGRVTLALGATCLRVLTNDDGSRAVGVVVQWSGREITVEADCVVVATGLEGTMQLLWQSRTGMHPRGLGNNTGNLGRHLVGHFTGIVFPILSWRALPANHTKTLAITSFYEGAPDWPYPLGSIQVAGQMPYWRLASLFKRLPAWLLAKRSLMMFYMVEAVPGTNSGWAITADGIGPLVEPPLCRRTFDKARQVAADIVRRAGYRVMARGNAPALWHRCGTARIGLNPASSVCNADCEVHDIAGLYIADASSLPSAGAVNTCLTIVALALKAADAMLVKLAARPSTPTL
jgi:choline dehydrogenase-like flavoprotein